MDENFIDGFVEVGEGTYFFLNIQGRAYLL